jgi:hypothetical protein
MASTGIGARPHTLAPWPTVIVIVLLAVTAPAVRIINHHEQGWLLRRVRLDRVQCARHPGLRLIAAIVRNSATSLLPRRKSRRTRIVS